MSEQDNAVNVGVVGAGWWATAAHIPGIQNHDAGRLCAVQSRTREKADMVASDFNADQAFQDYRELVTYDPVEAVVVSTTPNMHYEQTKFALEHDKPVLVEKPMTFTAAEARELCELADRKNLELLISCPWHYTDHGKKARELIGNGELGDVRMISILMTNPIDKILKGIDNSPTHDDEEDYVEPNEGSYSDPEVAGGGQIYCQVSHAAAYLPFLTGLEPEEVYARFDSAGADVDVYDALTITLNNGAQVSLASTGATPRNERNYEVRVYGTKGLLLLELWKGTMEFVPFDGDRTTFPDLEEDDIYPEQAPVHNLIDVCLGQAANGSEGRLGLSAMEVIEAACKSADSHQPVHVEDL